MINGVNIIIMPFFSTGYDMRFDIKYAYFNFLQSVPPPAIHDMRLHRTSCLITCCHASGFSLEDASNAKGYATDGGEEEK